MGTRRVPLVNGEIYHIFSKSISDLKIFRNKYEYERMKTALKYYQLENPPSRFSLFLNLENKTGFYQKYITPRKNIVDIIAYCLMPAHIHLVLKQIKDNGISTYIRNLLNSYTRYFNIKNKRKGPLWESRFKNIHVYTDEQILHLTRYIHLNPVTAYLVNRPEDWKFSSYNEYIGKVKDDNKTCNFLDILEIDPERYIEFVDSQIDYQRELAKSKEIYTP